MSSGDAMNLDAILGGYDRLFQAVGVGMSSFNRAIAGPAVNNN